MVNNLLRHKAPFAGLAAAASVASLLLAPGAALAQGAANTAPQTANYTLVFLVALALYLPILIGLVLSIRLLMKIAGEQYTAWAGSFPHLCDTGVRDEQQFRDLKRSCFLGDDEACAKLSCHVTDHKEPAK